MLKTYESQIIDLAHAHGIPIKEALEHAGVAITTWRRATVYGDYNLTHETAQRITAAIIDLGRPKNAAA